MLVCHYYKTDNYHIEGFSLFPIRRSLREIIIINEMVANLQ